jgi:hypothetical protein
LEGIGIACFDHETVHELDEAIIENVRDGNLEDGDIPEWK